MNLALVRQTLGILDKLSEDELKLAATQYVLDDPYQASVLLDTLRTEFNIIEKELMNDQTD